MVALLFSSWLGVTQQVPKRFSLLDASETGITFTNIIRDSQEKNLLMYANFYGGAGVGVGDFNNDGLQDIFFAGNTVPDKLYMNQGNFSFKDVTPTSGIQDDGGWSTGVTLADVNNDGHLDIYVSRELYDDKPEWRTNLLYINKGDGTFTERAKEFGVADSQRTRHATFLDYDKDGLLDLFLLTQPPNPGSYSKFFGTDLQSPEYHMTLLKNTGKDRFVDVSEQAGVKMTGFPNGVSASDLNNDGWTDLYIANDFQIADFLLINNRDGTFTNTVDQAMNHISYYSMGVDVADINNDALLDVFVLDMVAEDNFRQKSNMSGMNPKAFWKVVSDGGHYQYMYNALHLNNGNGTFSDVAQIAGMAATDWSWANLMADFDNDGLKDAFVTNGLLYDIRNTDADRNVAAYINKITYDYVLNNPDGGDLKSIWEILDLDKVIALMPSQPLKNYVFKNRGGLRFKKVMDDWGLDQESFSNGAAYADFDNDGDLDLVVNNINSKAFVYRNNSEKIGKANYLRFELKDPSHKPVFGTRALLYSGKDIQLQETTNVRGIYSTSEAFLHFGLGDLTKVDSVAITWPDGSKTIRRNLAVNQTVPLNKEDALQPEAVALASKTKAPFFIEDSNFLEHAHTENSFDDYALQVLLPHKLSQFGPALAQGDINNDGLDDFFVGGATGYPAALYLQQTDGSFLKQGEDFWGKEKGYEDVDALFVDINNDGLQDLYVVSGGNEYPKNDLHYVDRVYMNKGNGSFGKGAIVNVLPMSGSVVKAQDYDEDGDMDLFVGGRHVPGNYPLPASSMLLKNENGQLVNASRKMAKGFKDLGMVTDATWSDYDDDGDMDLVVVGEWMPLTFFKNGDNELHKDTEIRGLELSKGWWFSLEKGDFDEDGDMDFIAGNLGLNYKYKTSTETPFDIYFNDFDKNGRPDIVLGYYNEDKHYPLRGFSCSSEQIPQLKEKFKKYDVFAALELDDVYGEKALQNSLHYTTDTFASSYIENLGDGTFSLSPLPNYAQLSNINDMILDDFDQDGHLDVLAVQNLFVSEIETPRNDAGTGLLLLGKGDGTFTVCQYAQSGFFANGDAKKIIPLTTPNGKKVVVGSNNGKLQTFEFNGNGAVEANSLNR